MPSTVIVHHTIEPRNDGTLLSSSPAFPQTPSLAPLQTWCYNDIQSGETCVVRLYEQHALDQANGSQSGEVGLTWELSWFEGGRNTLREVISEPEGRQAAPAACRARFFFPGADPGKYLYTDVVDVGNAPRWGDAVDGRTPAARAPPPAKELGGVVFLSARHVLVRTGLEEASREARGRGTCEVSDGEPGAGCRPPALSLFFLREENSPIRDPHDGGGRSSPRRRWGLSARAVRLTTGPDAPRPKTRAVPTGDDHKDGKDRVSRWFRVLHVSMLPKVIVEDDFGRSAADASTGTRPPSARLVYLLSAESEDGAAGNFDFVVGALSVAVREDGRTPTGQPDGPASSSSSPALTVVREHVHVERGVAFAASDPAPGGGPMPGLLPTDCLWLLVPGAMRAFAESWLRSRTAAGPPAVLPGRLIGVLPAAFRAAKGPPRVYISHPPRLHCCGAREKDRGSREAHEAAPYRIPIDDEANGSDLEEAYIGVSLFSKTAGDTAAVRGDIPSEDIENEIAPLDREAEPAEDAEQALERWMNGEKLVYLVPLHDEGLRKRPLTSPLCTALPLSNGANDPRDADVIASSPVFVEIVVDFLGRPGAGRAVKPGVYVADLTWKDVLHRRVHDGGLAGKPPVLRVPTHGSVVWAGLEAILSPPARREGESAGVGAKDASRYAWLPCSPLSPFSITLTAGAAVGCRTFLARHPVRASWRLFDVYAGGWGPAREGSNAGGWADVLYLRTSPPPESHPSGWEDAIDDEREDADEEALFTDCRIAEAQSRNEDPPKVAWMLVNKIWSSASGGVRDACTRLLRVISEHPYIADLHGSGGWVSLEAYLRDLDAILARQPYQSDIAIFSTNFSRCFLMLLVHLDWLAASERARSIHRWVALFFIGGILPPSSGGGEGLPSIANDADGDSQAQLVIAMQYLVYRGASFSPYSEPSRSPLRGEAGATPQAPCPLSSSEQLAWFRRMLLLYIHRHPAVPLEVLLEDLLTKCGAFAGGRRPQEGADDRLECALLCAVDVELLMRSLACLSVYGGGLLSPRDFIPLCCPSKRGGMPAALCFIAAAVDVAAHPGPWGLRRKDLLERVGMWRQLANENASTRSTTDAVVPSWVPSFLLPDGPTWLALADYPWAALPPLGVLLFWLESTRDGEGGGEAANRSPYSDPSSPQRAPQATDSLFSLNGRLPKALHVLYWLSQGQEEIAGDLFQAMHVVARASQAKSEDCVRAADRESILCDAVSSPSSSCTPQRSVSLGAFAALLDPQTLLPSNRKELKEGAEEENGDGAMRVSASESFLVARVLHECLACCTGKTMRHLVAAAAFSVLPTTPSSPSATSLDGGAEMDEMHRRTTFLLGLIHDRELCLQDLGEVGEAGGLHRLALELAARVWEFVLLKDAAAAMNTILIEKLLDAFIYLQNTQEGLQRNPQQYAEPTRRANRLLHANLGSLLFRFMRGVFMVMLPKQLERVFIDEALMPGPKHAQKDVPVYTQYDSIALPIGPLQAVDRRGVVGAASAKNPRPAPAAGTTMQAGEVVETTRRHVKRLLDLFQTFGPRVRCLRALYAITPTAMDFVKLAGQQRAQLPRNKLVSMKLESPVFQAPTDRKDAPQKKASDDDDNDDDDDGSPSPQRPGEERMHTDIPVLLPVPLSYVLASQAAPTDPGKLRFVSVLLRRQIKQLILQYLWDKEILECVRNSSCEVLYGPEARAGYDRARFAGSEPSSSGVSPRDSPLTLRARAFDCKDYINDMVEALDPIAQALSRTALGLYEPLIVLLFLDITAGLVDAGGAGDPRAIEFPPPTAASMRACVGIAARRTVDGLARAPKAVLRGLLRRAFHAYLGPGEGDFPARAAFDAVRAEFPAGGGLAPVSSAPAEGAALFAEKAALFSEKTALFADGEVRGIGDGPPTPDAPGWGYGPDPINAGLSAIAGAGGGLLSALTTIRTRLKATVAPAPRAQGEEERPRGEAGKGGGREASASAPRVQEALATPPRFNTERRAYGRPPIPQEGGAAVRGEAAVGESSRRKPKRAPLAVALPSESARPLTPFSAPEALEKVENEAKAAAVVVEASWSANPGSPPPPPDWSTPARPVGPNAEALIHERGIPDVAGDGLPVKRPARKAAAPKGRRGRGLGLGLVVMDLPPSDAQPEKDGAELPT